MSKTTKRIIIIVICLWQLWIHVYGEQNDPLIDDELFKYVLTVQNGAVSCGTMRKKFACHNCLFTLLAVADPGGGHGAMALPNGPVM